jgi:peptidoglycan/LPS O-acetylase OafA/YrhL
VNLSLIVISPIPFLILIPFSKRNDLFNQLDGFSSLLNLSLIYAVIAVLGVWDHTESSISKSMGTWTYPLYLFHWPIIHLFLGSWDSWATFLSRQSSLFPYVDLYLNFLPTMGLSGFFTYFWLILERNFINRLRLSS